MAKRKPSTEKVAEKSEIKRSFFAFFSVLGFLLAINKYLFFLKVCYAKIVN